jgi:pilus assembly protein FimV
MNRKGPPAAIATLLGLALLGLAPLESAALGLGDIELRSALNQRLEARIMLVSVGATADEDIKVALADAAAFERAGLPRPAVLGSLRFAVMREPGAGSYIQVTSRESMTEPALSFIIEVDSPTGRLMREYSVLLEARI